MDREPPAFRDPSGGPVLAFAGPFAPQSGQHLVAQAFHILRTYLQPHARLVLAGEGADAQYVDVLRQYVRELYLPQVSIIATSADPEPAAVYRGSDICVCLSAHPEAGTALLAPMAAGVSILAWATPSVEAAAGGAALLLPEPSPVLAAEAIATLINEPALRAALVKSGLQRVEAPRRPAPP